MRTEVSPAASARETPGARAGRRCSSSSRLRERYPDAADGLASLRRPARHRRCRARAHRPARGRPGCGAGTCQLRRGRGARPEGARWPTSARAPGCPACRSRSCGPTCTWCSSSRCCGGRPSSARRSTPSGSPTGSRCCAAGPRSHAGLGVDVVTARAVAPLDRLAGWTLPAGPGRGHRCSRSRGTGALDEVAASQQALERLGGGHAEVLTCGAGLVEPATTVVRVVRLTAGRRKGGSMSSRTGRDGDAGLGWPATDAPRRAAHRPVGVAPRPRRCAPHAVTLTSSRSTRERRRHPARPRGRDRRRGEDTPLRRRPAAPGANARASPSPTRRAASARRPPRSTSPPRSRCRACACSCSTSTRRATPPPRSASTTTPRCPSVYDVLIEGRPLGEVVARVPAIDGLWCAPATLDLAGAEIELVSRGGPRAPAAHGGRRLPPGARGRPTAASTTCWSTARRAWACSPSTPSSRRRGAHPDPVRVLRARGSGPAHAHRRAGHRASSTPGCTSRRSCSPCTTAAPGWPPRSPTRCASHFGDGRAADGDPALGAGLGGAVVRADGAHLRPGRPRRAAYLEAARELARGVAPAERRRAGGGDDPGAQDALPGRHRRHCSAATAASGGRSRSTGPSPPDRPDVGSATPRRIQERAR